MACFNKIFKTILPILVMILVITGFHFTDIILLKFYPPIMNFALFVLFFTSIFQEKTIIQKFALLAEPNPNRHIMDYTRKLTYIWSAFMFVNFLISVATIFMSKEVWEIYNGIISYTLVGIIFAIEYIVRINFKRKYGRIESKDC